MGKYPRAELESAFAEYNRARDEASRSGDWSIWAARFREDAHYIEHAYGEMHGRAEIEKWITDVMAPFPTMTFPQDWVAFDEPRDAIVFQCQNAFPEPFRDDGTPFQFPTWTRLVYGGDGLWASEEDMYNPARDAPVVIKDWIRAGGQFQASEQVHMKHR